MTAAGKRAKVPALEVLDDLEPMLARLKLTATRDKLDTLFDQAGRAKLNCASRCRCRALPKLRARMAVRCTMHQHHRVFLLQRQEKKIPRFKLEKVAPFKSSDNRDALL